MIPTMAIEKKPDEKPEPPLKHMPQAQPPPKTTCGIIMPISTIDGCTADHWEDVREIIESCVEDAGFAPNLVSDANEVGVIHSRIIQNLYSNEIVVCDVSGKNPNVMFELGIRLAFDKATVIVKDDKTDYSFDTSPIEHVPYPRDLRFSKVTAFKEKLVSKIQATHKKAKEDPEYSMFVKHFGELKPAKLQANEVPLEKFVQTFAKEMREERFALRSLLTRELRDLRDGSPAENRTLHWIQKKVDGLSGFENQKEDMWTRILELEDAQKRMAELQRLGKPMTP